MNTPLTRRSSMYPSLRTLRRNPIGRKKQFSKKKSTQSSTSRPTSRSTQSSTSRPTSTSSIDIMRNLNEMVAIIDKNADYAGDLLIPFVDSYDNPMYNSKVK